MCFSWWFVETKQSCPLKKTFAVFPKNSFLPSPKANHRICARASGDTRERVKGFVPSDRGPTTVLCRVTGAQQLFCAETQGPHNSFAPSGDRIIHKSVPVRFWVAIGYFVPQLQKRRLVSIKRLGSPHSMFLPARALAKHKTLPLLTFSVFLF